MGLLLPHWILTSFPSMTTLPATALRSAAISAALRSEKLTKATFEVGTSTIDLSEGGAREGVERKKERMRSSVAVSGREERKSEVCGERSQLSR